MVANLFIVAVEISPKWSNLVRKNLFIVATTAAISRVAVIERLCTEFIKISSWTVTY